MLVRSASANSTASASSTLLLSITSVVSMFVFVSDRSPQHTVATASSPNWLLEISQCVMLWFVWNKTQSAAISLSTQSVGLERSITGKTKVAIVLSCNDNDLCNDKGNKLALKQVQQYANTADLY